MVIPEGTPLFFFFWNFLLNFLSTLKKMQIFGCSMLRRLSGWSLLGWFLNCIWGTHWRVLHLHVNFKTFLDWLLDWGEGGRLHLYRKLVRNMRAAAYRIIESLLGYLGSVEFASGVTSLGARVCAQGHFPATFRLREFAFRVPKSKVCMFTWRL
jgi:hypothetical protein